MRASASVTISTGKNLKVDRYGKNTESCAHNSMAWTKILDASAIPEQYDLRFGEQASSLHGIQAN